MTASRLWTIFCDVCGHWSNAGVEHTAAKARAGLRKNGWRLGLPGGRDICPACVRDGKT